MQPPTGPSTSLPDPARETAPSGPDTFYRMIRDATLALVAPLSPEDMVVQSMSLTSPVKWHLAHTTWFFETFVLERHHKNFSPFRSGYRVLFNSYYNTVGDQHSRPDRGLLTRPPLEEVLEYRRHVDDALMRLFDQGEMTASMESVVQVGLHHEQQHQELILMDIKHMLSCNPLRPAYDALPLPPAGSTPPLVWHPHEGGPATVGAGDEGFSFDNEKPRHLVHLEPYELASRPVTNGEFLEFIGDGGYERPDLWLSDGWDAVRARGWKSPLYWLEGSGSPEVFTLGGPRPVGLDESVCHVSYYEADAYARWAGARLPTEAEWERGAEELPIEGNFAETGLLHPAPSSHSEARSARPHKVYGDVWEWTASPYVPYPGYEQPGGAFGEYNAKFMCNQMVLRGGACVTPLTHIRPTYRNFFYPDNRWQFGGIRLARNAR